MILVDTSIWVDHLRAADDRLVALLEGGQVLAHPFVIGELSLGHLRQREAVISALQRLPRVDVATDSEVMFLIDTHRLFGIGIGYIDAHLLASVRLTADVMLWTRDRRLHRTAIQLGLGARFVD